MNIVHIIPVDGIGGTETAARSMATADTLNCDFILVLVAGHTIAKKKQRIIESPFKSENNPLAYFRVIISILRKKPDVLICSLWRSMLVGIVIKLLKPSTRLVCFLHSVSTTHFHKVDLIVSKSMMRICDVIWADSASTLDSRIGGSKKKSPSRVISFVTAHYPQTRPASPCSPNFVFWGRLHRHKGIDRAISFMSELLDLGCDGKFEIWGPDGGELDYLSNLVDEKGISDHIAFMGAAQSCNLMEIAARNSFFLQFSHYEGMAMSVVEAMQFGLVPVVTPVGEISRYCQAGTNAVIVDNVEKPEHAINEVLMLLQDEDRYRQYQHAAQSYWSYSKLYRDDVCEAAAELSVSQFAKNEGKK